MVKVILLLFFLLPMANHICAKDKSGLVGLGILPGALSWPNSESRVLLLRVNPLIGVHRDVYGVDVGVFNVVKGHMGGLQGGLFNYNGKIATIFGGQFGAINWNGGAIYGTGVQLALLLNHNKGKGYLIGLQVAPINLSPRSRSYGVVLGGLNNNGMVGGFQLGVVNYARVVNGFQIGLINYAKNLIGLQIGLLNTNGKSGLTLPVINIGF